MQSPSLAPECASAAFRLWMSKLTAQVRALPLGANLEEYSCPGGAISNEIAYRLLASSKYPLVEAAQVAGRSIPQWRVSIST